MSQYCSNCYANFTNSYSSNYEDTGYCTGCVSNNPSIRSFVKAEIAARPREVQEEAELKAVFAEWKTGDRAQACYDATMCFDTSRFDRFVGMCESAVRIARSAYTVPRFGFGGKDTDDVISMLNTILLMKECLGARVAVATDAAILARLAQVTEARA